MSSEALAKKKWTSGSKPLIVILYITLAYLFIVQAYPFFWSVKVSLTDQKIGKGGAFIGFANYLSLIEDPTFWMAMRFTFEFVFLTVLFKLLFGMLMALTLNKPFRFRALWRALLFLPWALPTLTSVLTWRWMLGDIGGIINFGLQKMHLIDRPLAWLGSPVLAEISVMVVNIWRGIPFFGISILAALQSIPSELYEAAVVDGANTWRLFWSITVPSIMKSIMLVSLISMIWTFGDFSIIWIMTRGGPANHTHVLSTLSYIQAFQNLDVAKGIATSLFIVPIAILLMWFTLRLIQHGDEQ
ncbi:MAG: sugar ABC transporter permease [Rectinema sp.]